MHLYHTDSLSGLKSRCSYFDFSGHLGRKPESVKDGRAGEVFQSSRRYRLQEGFQYPLLAGRHRAKAAGGHNPVAALGHAPDLLRARQLVQGRGQS